ncbi:hypothetical protein DB347_11240 [Opitutaceae bacterium EW11]|nr:hypothetical protein DB347_11240 [Opitutaceae bacterium EW11]
MSSHAASAPAVLTADSHATAANKALLVGVAGIVVTLIGLFFSSGHVIAFSWLVGVSYWTALAIGMLLMVMIHHIFDASWSVVVRRQWEHGISAFIPLAVLFAPLVVLAWLPSTRDIVWPWMNPAHELHGHGTVGSDVLYIKKSGFLNRNMFTGMTLAFFAVWIWLSARLRKASFTQDTDGDIRWTRMNRVTSALGIPLTALALTFAAIYWIKSLEYHWFSTMYGVWFFANCIRGALCSTVLIMVWLYRRGDYNGVLNTNHFHSIGQLMLAFTIFWAYVTFSQYFLIWNANVPEETFWYNIREINADGSPNQWKYVGIIIILFGHFVVPFLYLLSYRNKIVQPRIRFIACWVLCVIFFDLCYNILPALKDDLGNAEPLFGINLLWTISAVVGVGGICVWSYLRSLPKEKLIPIRDPRIEESLTHHEQHAH